MAGWNNAVSQEESVPALASEVKKMAGFINQFFDAIQEWSRRTASSDADIRLHVGTQYWRFTN